MSKIAVVYWSGTGNTEAMARSVAEGAHSAGAEVEVLTAAEFGPDKLATYDAAAFGCPAMGAEQLEEDEFEPMFSGCKAALKGKKIALFGSYGWGDGEWMRSWEPPQSLMAPSSPATASYAPMRLTPRLSPPARRWARCWHSSAGAVMACSKTKKRGGDPLFFYFLSIVF